MGKTFFDESITNIITDSSKCIAGTEAYVGDKVYNIGIYKGETRSVYVVCTENNSLMCMDSIRPDLDKISAEKMFEDINKRVRNLSGEADVNTVCNPDENAGILKQPLIFEIKNGKLTAEEIKSSRIIMNEVADWLDELSVMKSAKLSARETETFQQEYEKIISTEFLPHKDDSVKDYSNTMTIVCIIFALLGVFFYSTCVFPVMAVVAGGFTAYRCFANKNTAAGVVCLLCVAAGLVFTYFGWTSFSESIRMK